MKIKKEYVVLIIVIISLSLYLTLRNKDRTHYLLPDIPDIAKKEISKIEIKKADTSIVLNKKDATWHIAPKGYPADTGKVNSMLDVIGELVLTTLVSEAKSYDSYDLTDDKKTTVKAWADDILKLEFEMGRAAPSWNHTFVKLAGDTRVYHARGNFKDKFDQTLEKLRDMAVLSFEQNEIEEIRIIKGKQSVILVQKQTPVKINADQESDDAEAPKTPTKVETTWESSDGKKGDESTLNSLFSTLSNLSCDKYIDDKEKESFTDPIYAIQLKGTYEYALSIFEKTEKDAKNYPAVSSENDYPFLLNDSQVDRIMKDPDEMLKKEDKS
jgi:hypothetical protein